jgi:hypothetical protein
MMHAIGLDATAVVVLVIWVYLVFARGQFWWLREFDDDIAPHEELRKWPRVVAIVPARNEAKTIARALESLAEQNYGGPFSIVVVDDDSTDGTAELALRAAAEADASARIVVQPAAPLPFGWTGKLWALNQGVESVGGALRGSRQASPATTNVERTETTHSLKSTSLAEFYWFTDADIVHAPDTLRRLVSRAESRCLALTSQMVLLRVETPAERLLIPPFLYFFLKLYPPRWIADSKARTAGAAGGCVLLRREALERIGGLAVIRGEVIDDCALARAVKQGGGRIWMGVTRASVSLREYAGVGEIRDMIARTAFTQLRYSPLLLAGTLMGMLLTYIAPIGLAFFAGTFAAACGIAAWVLMTVSFVPTLWHFRRSRYWALLLPLAALFYCYATWISAVRYWSGRGGQWKGRAQAARDLV